MYFLFPLVDRYEIRQMGKQSCVGNVRRLLQTVNYSKSLVTQSKNLPFRESISSEQEITVIKDKHVCEVFLSAKLMKFVLKQLCYEKTILKNNTKKPRQTCKHDYIWKLLRHSLSLCSTVFSCFLSGC